MKLFEIVERALKTAKVNAVMGKDLGFPIVVNDNEIIPATVALAKAADFRLLEGSFQHRDQVYLILFSYLWNFQIVLCGKGANLERVQRLQSDLSEVLSRV